MNDVNFADYIAGERERIGGEYGRLVGDRDDIDRQLSELHRELNAIDAYEQAKTGKKSRPASVARRPRDGSRRQKILSLVGDTSAGMTRGELIEACGLKGDKSGEMSVSNALTALTKAGALVRDGGKYHLPATDLRQAAE